MTVINHTQRNFTNGNITADFDRGKVKLPKLKEVKAKLHRNFSGQIKSVTVSQMPSGKYYVIKFWWKRNMWN